MGFAIIDAQHCGPQAYGVVPGAPDLVTPPAVAKSAGPSQYDNVGVASLDNPIVWLVGLVAVTLGLIGFASSARIGPVRGAIAVGKS